MYIVKKKMFLEKVYALFFLQVYNLNRDSQAEGSK